MIYHDEIEKEVLEYCKKSNIPIKNGIIPPIFVKEIETFVRVLNKTNRIKTREIEELNKYSLKNFIKVEMQSKSESPIEDFMLQAICQHGIEKHCRQQFEIGTKRVDFAFPIAKLVVECDGREYHHSDAEQIEKDQKRDIYLAKKGWFVKHFDGLMIRRNIEVCIKEIQEYLNPFLTIQTQ